RKRLEAALAKTPVAAPDPRTPHFDPYALRALALVAAVAAAFVAGDEKSARLASAFDWRASPNAGAMRVDAWLEPPAYTGRPPIMLGDTRGSAVEAPINSILRIRPSDASIFVAGALAPLADDAQPPTKSGPAPEQAYKLTGAAQVALPDGRNFELFAIPDRAPTIALTDKPRNNLRGTMTLAFKSEDDYGVVSGEAVFAKPPGGRRALFDPPRSPLALPPGMAGLGEGKATIDLGDSPYAGVKMTMRLIAKDAADNEGASAPLEVTLPQRHFVKPLARALVEQRRILALDPEARANVRAALEAIALAPEIFDTPSSIHLGLRAALRSLDGRRTDDELRGVADLLWAMALSLEDGDASQAERDLRAAQQELREAMQRGDEDEIAQKSQALREALDKFLQQFGSRLPKEGEPPREAGPDGDTVTPDDLQAMLDEMNQAMQSGDMAQAQRLLDELQDILENAQTPDGQSAQRDGRRQNMSKALSELDQLSREEQKLRDETFQGMKRPEEAEPDAMHRRLPPGLRPSEEGEAERQKQQALRERLERQQDALQQEGVENSEELDQARKAMKEAERALGKNGEGRGPAVEAQGRAIDALRRGADKLAQQMREGEQGAEGEGRQRGKRRSARGRDPFGRGANGRGAANSRYDPLGLPPAQRAHRVQEELRRRLSQPERPQEELDYLQRLLKR
ncbi:MAG: TIGR02302 family protein, partial [Methylocystis sp.]|nr:TIGR02302 family protein [Methylocystis sp.]